MLGTLWLGKTDKQRGPEILDLEQGADLSLGVVGNDQGDAPGEHPRAGG
ncbi:MAG TPA: hypothetical protein VGR45_19455 [Stellaceae bacterium]|nr:hypothetical protein [Stellaceae bacterium]